MTHLAFAIDGGGGNFTHQRNLAVALADEPEVESDFLTIAAAADDLWSLVPVIRNNLALAASARALAALEAVDRRRPVDAAFIHSQSLALFAPAWMRRIRTVISTDGTPANYDSFATALEHRVYSRPVEAAKTLWTRAVFACTPQIIGFSQWVKDSLVNDYRCPPEKVAVIPSGVDVRRWAPDPEKRPNDGKVRILFTGGHFARKGGPELLGWWDRQRREEVELHLVTQHPVPPQPGVLVHRGLVPNDPGLIALAQRCDFLVLPTRGDCFPFAVIEAQAAGLPAVVSDVGGMRDLVREGETGFLVPPGDAEALADRIERLVDDAGLRQRLGASARERAVTHFDAAINSRRVLALMLAIARA